jgi:hypothetical protein
MPIEKNRITTGKKLNDTYDALAKSQKQAVLSLVTYRYY